jgi:hypothetical protein
VALDTCRACRLPALPGYPHRHDSPARPDYDPMPPRPESTGAQFAILRAEYLAELPSRLHVRYVPSHTEAVRTSTYQGGRYVPSEREEDLLDTGQLGSPAWAPEFGRYVGAARYMLGEMVLADAALRPFPWARQLEGVRRWCTARHRTWYEHDARPLCWLLIRDLLTGATVDEAAATEEVDAAKAQELLVVAIGKWWAWVSNDLNGLDVRRTPRDNGN